MFTVVTAESLASIPRPPVRRILSLDEMGGDVFRGGSHTRAPRIYGGQALGQSLMAAGLTVDRDRHPHSLHGHFVHPGRSDEPVDYHVERLRDGGSFTTRQVRAVQNDRTIFLATASFQRPEVGLEHQHPVSSPATPPEELPRFEDSLDPEELREATWLLPLFKNIGVDFRFPEEYPRLANRRGESRPPRQRAWVRTPEPLGDDLLVQAAGFAYCSDLFLLSAALPPHARHIDTPGLQLASLDHTVWLHAPFRADEWHLHEQHGYRMVGGRGLSRGYLFDRDGNLLASTAQEGLLRFRD
ncbi:acyl-CoA thioesterase [Rhodococcus aetherivorans]|uniref:acyl-CoA thioesterase n=1 Tax=Rhodococcus aetherivorans TaxID=191292 RepID=UPI00241C418F|nr:acyl-CoA thioesterase domain-containing protein [Rhodococcus aetherivorans]WFS11084.1 thioesterase family protein [Rhodococcus aetherivorans]